MTRPTNYDQAKQTYRKIEEHPGKKGGIYCPLVWTQPIETKILHTLLGNCAMVGIAENIIPASCSSQVEEIQETQFQNLEKIISKPSLS
jgi:hypothetical protein